MWMLLESLESNDALRELNYSRATMYNDNEMYGYNQERNSNFSDILNLILLYFTRKRNKKKRKTILSKLMKNIFELLPNLDRTNNIPLSYILDIL